MISYQGLVRTFPNCMVNDGRRYEDVVHDLYERAKIKNMDDWLENALNDIELNQKNHSK
ncbi:hypothetical protein L1032_03560 [Escherichia coli]|uniref:hypothetical protein n=1 Tax=Escherichia coli TaxID=562 RepID=UPI001F2875C8|nr:hypothetical protein [Escherichia coli]MCF3302112.1 hypothetical protein [Escherichia coli]MCF3374234.1 hypothetical protein [Escherichia coli]